MSLENIENRFFSIKANMDFLEGKLKSKEEFLTLEKKNRDDFLAANYIITEVAKNTQEKFKERVEKLVTLAIQSVFEDNYEFVLKFERKRNQTECQLIVMENGIEFVPKDDMGVGIIDIISFALRIVLWSLQSPKSRAFFVLDEPLKHVGSGTEEEIIRAAKMMKELSHKLKFQLVIATHEPQLVMIIDKAYKFKRVGGKSVVALIKDK